MANQARIPIRIESLLLSIRQLVAGATLTPLGRVMLLRGSLQVGIAFVSNICQLCLTA
jgi:hypothetical protein